MKRNFVVFLSIVWLVAGTTGCQTLKNITPGSSKAPEPTLYSQVPAEYQAPVDDALVELQTAKDSLALAKEQVVLAKLKKERANLEKKISDKSEDLAETAVKKAETTIELRKMVAIDKAGLGEKKSNIEEIADLRKDELSLESKFIKTQAKIETMKLDLRDLSAKIEEQAAKVSSN